MIYGAVFIAIIATGLTLMGDVSVLGFVSSIVSGTLIGCAAIAVLWLDVVWSGRISREASVVSPILAAISAVTLWVAFTHMPFHVVFG